MATSLVRRRWRQYRSVRAIAVVGVAIAGEPAGEFGMRVLATHRGDLVGVWRVDGELEAEAVRRFHIHRHAIAVVDLAYRHVGRLRALHEFVEGCLRDFERDVPGATDILQDSAVLFPGFLVGELEKGERTAVAHFVEGVAVVDLAADFRAEGAFAPGGDEGNAE